MKNSAKHFLSCYKGTVQLYRKQQSKIFYIKNKKVDLKSKKHILNYYVCSGKGTNIIGVVHNKEILMVKKDIKRARCYESCLLLFTVCFDFNNQIFYMKSIQGVS